ncbi:hypothetical protein X975_27119, partial [Stegodyphus mimosarum]
MNNQIKLHTNGFSTTLSCVVIYSVELWTAANKFAKLWVQNIMPMLGDFGVFRIDMVLTAEKL